MSEDRDDDIQLGVGVFELSKDHPYTRAAVRHDAAYEAHHRHVPGPTREEADEAFDRAVHLIADNDINLQGEPHDSGFARWYNRRLADLIGWIPKTVLGTMAWRGWFYRRKE